MTKGNVEISPGDIDATILKMDAIAKKRRKSDKLELTKDERIQRDEAKRALRFEESNRKNELNHAIVYDLRKAVKLRNALAKVVTLMAVGQLITTNLVVITMFGWQVLGGHQMPSDRAILGWLASTAVEVIGLYAVVLRGIFTPSSIRSIR